VSARGALPGIGYMLASMSCIAIVDGIAKYLVQSLNGVQVAWGYFLATLIVLHAYAVLTRKPYRAMLRSDRRILQLARAACLVLSLSSMFFSLRYLPLAEATLISFMAPLFIVVLAGPLLGERVSLGRWCAVLVGMAGAVLVLRPGSAVFQWPALAALNGALFFALFNIVTRRLGGADGIPTTLLHTFGIGAVLLSPAMPLVWTNPTRIEWLVLLCSGGVGLVAHLSLVRALTLVEASALAPLAYVRLLWAIGIGLAVFGQAPDAIALLGGAVIIASGLFIVHGATHR
jgi:drug/metabolite transporter (DMT)-like permease